MIYKDLKSAIQVTNKEIEEAAEHTLEEAGQFARREAISTDLFRVSDSFKQATQFTKLDRFNGFVQTHLDYAQYLEYGNDSEGPYIYPKNKKVLHFVVGGRDVFTKYVRSHHAYPYMANAGDKLNEVIDKVFEENLTKTLT